MFCIIRSVVIAAAVLYCHLSTAQFLPEDQVPLAVQNQIVADVMAEHGHLDMRALQASFRDWLLAQPLPDADGALLDSGTCSDCTPPTDGENPIFPSVRDVAIITNQGRIRPSFKVKWRKPVRLPREIRDLYELDSYEVYLTRDDGAYEHHVITKTLLTDGTEKLKRRIRFRRREPGFYTVSVRPVYVDAQSTTTALIQGNESKFTFTTSTAKAGDPVIRTSSGGGKGGWGGGEGAELGPDSSVDEVFDAANTNTNQNLYDCIIADPAYNGTTEVGQIDILDCANHSPMITSILELEHFSGLRDLDLENNNIDDLTGLSGLSNIESLNLSNNDNIPFTGSVLITGLELLSTADMDSLTHLYLDDMELAGIPALNSDAAYITVSLENNDLGNSTLGLPACPAAPPSGDADRVQISHLRVSGNNMQDEHTRHIAPFIVGSLSADNNQFSNVRTSSCDTLARVGGLGISENSFPSNVLGSSFDLSGYQFTWFSMRDTDVTELTHKLPEVCATIELSNNPMAESVLGSIADLPAVAPYQLYLSGSDGLQCNSVDALSDWYWANVGSACQLGLPFEISVPASCDPSAPEGFAVSLESLDTNQVTYRATWQPVPTSWGVTHYRIAYLGFNPGEILIENSGEPISFFSADSPGNTYHTFSIKSCTSSNPLDCSPASAIVEPQYPLLQPYNLNVQYFSNSTFVEWQYPSVPPGSQLPAGSEFRVSPLFSTPGAPATETVPYNPISQTPGILLSNIGAYPGGKIKIRLCDGNGAASECGPPANLSILAPPTASVNIPAPANVMINQSGSAFTGDEFTLSWSASTDPEVDYYQITELPVDQITSNGTRIFTEETQIRVKRDLHRTGNYFAVEACYRDRENGDVCSDTSGISPQFDVPQDASLGTVAGLCWVYQDPNNPSDSNRPFRLRWTYDTAQHDVPRFFDATYSNITIPDPAPQGFNTTLEFAESDYTTNGGGTWFWETGTLYSQAFEDGGLVTENNYWITTRTQGDGEPATGPSSTPITPVLYNNGNPILNPASQCSGVLAQPANPPAIPDMSGGPGDLDPGHWGDDPDHLGSGWRFFWASDLRADDVHEAYGITYDLIAFWYTYRQFDNGEWSPVWYFSRMKITDNANDEGTHFQGDLIYPQKLAEDELAGTVELYFEHPETENASGEPNQNAYIIVNLDHDDSNTGTLAHALHDISLDHQVINNSDPNPFDHYSGVWTPGPLFTDGEILANHDFFLVDWIEKELYSIGINFFDSNGDPIWLLTQNCDGTDCTQPFGSGAYTRYDALHNTYPGNNPLGIVPHAWVAQRQLGNFQITANGSAGRVYRNYPTPVDNKNDRFDGLACFDIDISSAQIPGRAAALHLGNSGCTNVNAATEQIQKVANLHDIEYRVGADPNSTAESCHLDAQNPVCNIYLTWFTDDYFSEVEPFYTVDGLSQKHHLSEICTAGGSTNVNGGDPRFVVADYYCPIEQAGAYVFELGSRIATTSGIQIATTGDVVAESRILTVTGQSPTSGAVTAVPDEPRNTATTHTLAMSSVDHDQEIGVLAGEAAVSGGAATYNIPINIPPGRQGMQPALSLNYNSRAGNGTAGIGWSLSAGSSISRCPATLAQDGFGSGVTYDDSDRLCLDGQRLMAVSGNYWAAGSKYRSEVDNFLLVTLNGANGDTSGCAVSFTVQGKDNITREYGGATADQNAPEKVRPVPVSGTECVVNSWLLDTETDSSGNTIEYSYSTTGTGNGEHLLDMIQYTGDSSGPGNRRVEFNYQARDAGDLSESYLHGFHSQQTLRLWDIQTFEHNDLVRTYTLTYTPSNASGRELLRTVQECAEDGGNTSCLDATHFEWGDSAPQSTYGRMQTGQTQPDGSIVFADITGDPLRNDVLTGVSGRVLVTPMADFDGDGTRELHVQDGFTRSLVSLTAEGVERWRVSFDLSEQVANRNSDGSLQQFATAFINPVELDSAILQRTAEFLEGQQYTPAEITAIEEQVTETLTMEFLTQGTIPGGFFNDFDNDGRADLFGAMPDNNGGYYLAFTHYRFDNTNPFTFDDVFDFVETDLPLTVITSNDVSFVSETPMLADVNNDGLQDALVYTTTDTGVQCGSSGTHATALKLWLNQGQNQTTGVYEFDLATTPDNDGIIYIWPCHTIDGQQVREIGRRPSITDFNGDGRLDIALASQVPDIFIPEYDFGDITIYNVVIDLPYQEATSRIMYLDDVVAGTNVSSTVQDMWSDQGNSIGLYSDPRLTFTMPLDVNGDGLQDYLLMPNADADADGTDPNVPDKGKWYVQINQGGSLAAPVEIVFPGGALSWIKDRAMAAHPEHGTATSVSPIVAPRYGSLIKPMDWNADGRTDLLIPRQMHQAICIRLHLDTIENQNRFGTYCPGNMDVAPFEPDANSELTAPGDNNVDHSIGGIYYAGRGHRNPTTYYMSVLQLNYNAALNRYEFEVNSPQDLIASNSSRIADFNGDGSPEILTTFGCVEVNNGTPVPGHPEVFNISTRTVCTTDLSEFIDPPGATGYVAAMQSYMSEDFHCYYTNTPSNGHACDTQGTGAGSSERGYYLTSLLQNNDQVVDLLKAVEDGFANRSEWNYAPLSSDPIRLGADLQPIDLQLYVIPNRELGIDYLQYSPDDHFYFASSMFVVSEFNQSNGLTDPAVSGLLQNTTYYGYEEAVYNNRGRGFQGFRKVVSEQVMMNPAAPLDMDDPANNLRTVSVFHQIFPLAGRLQASYSEQASNAYTPTQDRNLTDGSFDMPDNVLSSTSYDWGCRMHTGTEVDMCYISSQITGMQVVDAYAEVAGASGNHGIYHPILKFSRSEQHELDGMIFAFTEATRVYDEYGNVTSETTELTNDLDGGTNADFFQRQTVTNSYTNDQTNWWLGRLDRSYNDTFVNYGGALNDAPSEVPKQVTRLFDYHLTHRKPSCQVVVENDQPLPSSMPCDTSGYTAAGYAWQSTNSSYDSHGNPLSIDVDASQLDAIRSTSTVYDTEQYFPSSVTNAKGHMVHTEIDAREGNPVMVTDANGLITKMDYDAFGRETETWYPVNSSIAETDIDNHYAPRSRVVYSDSATASYCGTLPASAVYCTIAITDGAPVVRQYFDALNRVIETRSNAYAGNVSGMQVYTGSIYNARGQVFRETVPNYDSLGMDWAEYRYDALARVITKSQPSSLSSSAMLYTHYAHDGMHTTIHLNDQTTPHGGVCAASSTATLTGQLCVSRTYATNGWLLATTDAHGETTRYWYDGQGNPTLIEDPDFNPSTGRGNLTRSGYNQLGHRTSMQDPNMGNSTYLYNGLGEVGLQTDANGQQTAFVYDVLGRLLSRSSTTLDTELGSMEDQWSYDATGQLGLVTQTTRTQGLSDANQNPFTHTTFSKTYDYDSFLRPAGYTVVLDPYRYSASSNNQPVFASSPSYTVSMQYDSYFGRVKAITYPQERFREFTRFDINGFVQEQGDSQEQNNPLRSVLGYTEAGQVMAEQFANGVIQHYGHDGRTFQMQNTIIDPQVGDQHTYSYTHDLFDNLVSQRKQATINSTSVDITETFSFDHLHRLRKSTRPAQQIDYAYDELGNITSKSDYANSYAYDQVMGCGTAAAGPNAVTQADGYSYGYDDNGNLTCGQTHQGSLEIRYDHTNKPFRITRGVNTHEFWYDSEDQRYYQEDNQDGNTLYVGKMFEQKGSTQFKLYIGNYALFNVDITDPNNTGITYLHKDRLGSVVSITDEAGLEVSGSGRGFDPFGKPREENWDDSTNPDGDLNGFDETTRGYTGHEHLNGADIIHMNGRAYDYNLGRFLSVDPFIQAPQNSQSLNPYSYIMNNPMAGTDPSGYISEFSSDSCYIDTRCGGGRSRLREGNPDERANRRNGAQGTEGKTNKGTNIADLGGQVERSDANNLNAKDQMNGAGLDQTFACIQCIRQRNAPDPVDIAGGDGGTEVEKEPGFFGQIADGLEQAERHISNTGDDDFSLFVLTNFIIVPAKELSQAIDDGNAGAIAIAGAGLFIRGSKAAKGASELQFGRKLDFLFNKNINPANPKNVKRARGNADRIGIADTPTNRAEVKRRFNEAFNDPSSIVGPGKAPGSNLREFFLPGVTGTGSKIQFVEQGGKVITIIAK